MKIFSRPQRVLWIIVSIACMVFVGCSDAQQYSESEKLWTSPGNFIVSYGPIMEPYSSKIDNSYYLYSPSGQQLGWLQGQGSWAPVALATRKGSYGYFAGSINNLGDGTQKVSFLKESPVSFYGSSPNGNLAIAIINDSNSAEFHHSFVAFYEESTSKGTVPTVPHSLAVGEEAALVVGDSYEGERYEKDLVLIRNDGSIKKINFPLGYDENIPDFKYPHVNYLGNGVFEVLEGITKGERTDFKSFEVRIGDDDELTIQKVTHFSMNLHEDFAITQSLPFGENGFIDINGNVFINHRDTHLPEKTGNIRSFNAKAYIPVNFSTEALLGIRQKDCIEISRWDKPELVVARLKYEKKACSDDACGISSISRTL
ncbi:hypothetical protein UL82_07310 [Corynebacterium kutscheri]|uniref:Uncharacterized protein n=1 Tax=Corynebacterium kutscheri TaxID=35755 RepID=A0A0F6TE86_9CORY|nr:hypothetical protein [Corynebacterium kutscheri]AKE41624.1 hypothetical protein UL82_07310 [Corynebacterium kutscheri]VEH09950.1 Uncharacterised protein [Corynebacterium kutscheri]